MPIPKSEVEIVVAFTAQEKNSKKLKSVLEVRYCGPVAVLLDTNMANPLNQAYRAFLEMVIEELNT